MEQLGNGTDAGLLNQLALSLVSLPDSRRCYLRAAVGLSAEGLVPPRGIDVMITVPLKLEQDHVGQPVRSIPAVVKAYRFCLAVLIPLTFKLYSSQNPRRYQANGEGGD